MITDAAHADEVWRSGSGRPLGLSPAGVDALERLAIVEKVQLRRPVVA